jgi:hypothetical protein
VKLLNKTNFVSSTDKNKIFTYAPPQCLRAIEIDHMILPFLKQQQGNFVIQFAPNRVESIDASNMILGRNGWSVSNITIVGLQSLRSFCLRDSGLRHFQFVSLPDAFQLELIDLSLNFLETMTKLNFSKALVGSLPGVNRLI